MKTLFLISYLMMAGLAEAQPVSRLLLFSQEFRPGMVPSGREPGQTGNSSKTRFYIYITQTTTKLILFDRIRIGSQWYRISSIDTVGTPFYAEQPERKLLVPRTNNLVLQLNLGEKMDTAFMSKSYKAEAALYYKYSRKRYAVSCSRIKKLSPVLGI